MCYLDGPNTTKSHDLHVTSEMTCGDVVPLLCQQLVTNVNGMSRPAGHISLVQGESKSPSKLALYNIIMYITVFGSLKGILTVFDVTVMHEQCNGWLGVCAVDTRCLLWCRRPTCVHR